MPVRKFRNVEELNKPIWRSAGDPDLFRAIASVWVFARTVRPMTLQPGVRKFRSIAEMKARKP